jgi:GT2 family glycosyltransferase
VAAVALTGGRRPRAVRLFVASAGNHVMREIADVFASGFAANGVPADVAMDALPAAAPAAGLLQIVVAPHEFYPLFAAPRADGDATASLPAVHLLNVEQPGSPWFESACWYARGAAGVLDINAMSAAELRRRGLSAVHAPFGYVPPPADAAAAPERDVDVVFLGVSTPRREMFFARHAGFFAARPCRIHLARIERPRLATTPGFVTGPALSRLLRSSRVLLNVHGEPSAYFEWHRTLLAVANGCAVVSEAGDPSPLRPGEDLVIEELDRLVEECRRLLDDEDARAAMAERARRRAEEELGAAAVCRRVLETITVPASGRGLARSRPRASPVRAWPGAVAAARGIAARFDAMNARAGRAPERPLPAAAPDPSVPRAAARAARREEARRLALAGHPLAREEANAAARGGAMPGVTVMITVFNYEAHVGEALRSACAALTEGIPGGIEVVVVDDGSSDDSAAVVQAAMAASTTPIRLIRKALNTGLADARNLGVREARAPYVFVLDADNWIYPRCLSVLHHAIRDGGHDAVYGIIRKFDERGEPAGLTSFFPWDEREVVRLPYVDAMALFDRRALLAVDGYSTDLEWMGWEDYDLWLKLAQAGKSCALVPELLSAYRVHAGSMIHETNRHAAELARHFRRKFAPLALRHPDAPMLFGFPRE